MLSEGKSNTQHRGANETHECITTALKRKRKRTGRRQDTRDISWEQCGTMRKQTTRRVRYTPETNTGKRPRTGDHGMDSENGQTKGHNNHDQIAQRKHAGSRVGKRKRMGHHTLEDKHTPVRSCKTKRAQLTHRALRT